MHKSLSKHSHSTLALVSVATLIMPTLALAQTPTYSAPSAMQTTTVGAPMPAMMPSTGIHTTTNMPQGASALFPGTLKRGDSNNHVKDLQAILRSDPKIYPAGSVTGYFGPATEQAVKSLQAKYALPPTGIVDSATQAVLYPANSAVELGVITPNGGEAWTAGTPYQILWKASFSPNPVIYNACTGTGCPTPPCCKTMMQGAPTPVPAGINATMPTQTPPNAGMMNDAQIQQALPTSGGSAPVGVSGTGYATPGVVSGGGGSGSVGVGAYPQPVPAPSPMPITPSFFPRASLDLVRDNDPSYVYHIATVNVYESSASWTVPSDVPSGSDYRVRISIGGNVPCMYRLEATMKAGAASRASLPAIACPMMDYNGGFYASDTSDSTFSIKGSDTSNGNLADRVAALEQTVRMLQQQIQMLQNMLTPPPMAGGATQIRAVPPTATP